MIEFFKIIKRWLQNGQRQMPEVGHYFLLHLFLLYAACLGLVCRVGHLSDIISVSEARSLLENAFYSRKLKKSAKIPGFNKSSKYYRRRGRLTLVYLVRVVVKIELVAE